MLLFFVEWNGTERNGTTGMDGWMDGWREGGGLTDTLDHDPSSLDTGGDAVARQPDVGREDDRVPLRGPPRLGHPRLLPAPLPHRRAGPYVRRSVVFASVVVTPQSKHGMRGVAFFTSSPHPPIHLHTQMIDVMVPLGCGGCVHFAQPDALKGSLVHTLKEVRVRVCGLM